MTAAILRMNRRTFASLRKHRNYRLFFVGQVVSVTGTWMQRIAQAWFILQLTHSPLAVGFLALCQFLPFTVLGLFAGVIVDRLDAREDRNRDAGGPDGLRVGEPPPCARRDRAALHRTRSRALMGGWRCSMRRRGRR